jgi:FixJ family two-component response regulator
MEGMGGESMAIALASGVRGNLQPVGEAVKAGEGPTVFVLDDEGDVLRALSRLLRADRPDGAHLRRRPGLPRADGARTAPGCVILDLSMPELDGLAVQRLLAEKGCTLPVIFLSGNARRRRQRQRAPAGAPATSCPKPVDADELLARGARGRWKADRLAREALRGERR